jgi:hypothetical protein
MKQRRRQVIRAIELAKEAGLNPFAEVESDKHSYRNKVYKQFEQAAWDEHFAKHAVDGIYWEPQHHGGDRWWYDQKDGDCTLFYGRCKSGSRWFWRVWGHLKTGEDYLDAFGWADTEDTAKADAQEAIRRLAARRKTVVATSHGYASDKLKEINREKWKERPPADGSDAKFVEYLYDRWGGKFQITKKTAKRIYYRKDKQRREDDFAIGFVSREEVGSEWPSTENELDWKIRYLA